MWIWLRQEPNNKVDFIHQSEYLPTQLWPFVIETYQSSSSNLWTYFSDVTLHLPVLLANRHNMSPEAEEVDLWDLLETYRAAVRDKFDLYDMFSSNLNASDDMLIFYFEMLNYVDAQLRELMKDRVASLLKKDIKADVLSQSSSKKNKDENMAGLFCGEK